MIDVMAWRLSQSYCCTTRARAHVCNRGFVHDLVSFSSSTVHLLIPNEMGDWAALIISIIIPNLGGFVIGLIVSKNIPWYNNLKQPSFRPPNWLFGVAWTILYTLMGVSSYLIYEDGGFSQNAVPLGIYAGNVVLNWLWSIIFFGCHLIMLVDKAGYDF